MKKLFLLLLVAAFAMVGCDTPIDGDNTSTTEDPIFIVDVEGDYTVPASGGTAEILVISNIEYRVSIPTDAKSWITHTDTRSIRQEILVFTFTKNTTAKTRTAKVDLLGADNQVLTSIVFVQKAAVVEDPSEIELSANKTKLEVGGVVTFTVMEKSGNNVTASATIYDKDYNVIQNARYKATKEGTFKFFATRNGKTSNTVVITVGEGGDEPEQTEGAFLHRALLIDHTGVGCGNCPSAMDHLRVVANSDWHNYYNEVQCHAGKYAYDYGDPGYSEAAAALNTFQGNYGIINGYPSIAINFYSRASNYYSTNIITALEKVVKKDGADVGIALSVEKGASKVICSAQIKAAVSNEYKVNAWLLENNIYSPEQEGGSKEYHYYYNHALRSTSETFNKTNISGKSIGMLYIGETYDYNCEIPVDHTWEMNNLEVLIVVTARNGSNEWDVVNTAVCGVGQTTPFAYVK